MLRILAACAVMVWVPLWGLSADTYMSEPRRAALIQVQRLLLDDQFEAADSAVHAYLSTYQWDPGGYFLRAASLLAQMSDREENLYPEQIAEALDSVEVLAKRADTGSARNRAWMHFWMGQAKAHESIYAARFGSFAGAIGAGFDAKDEYEKGLALDSTLVDLYFGLGSYHYWKSAKAGVFRWLGIFRNDKNRGIRELERAATQSEVSRESALSSLIWVYFDNGDFDSAVVLAQRAAAEYPNGKSFLWPLGKAYYDKKRYTEAIAVFGQLRERFNAEPGNYFNLIECDFYIARSYEQLGEEVSAVNSATRLIEYSGKLSKTIRHRQRSKLGYLSHLAGKD